MTLQRTVALAAGFAATTLTTSAIAGEVEYSHDNGQMATAVGPPGSFPTDPETLWGNYFYAEEGGERITTISAAFGPTFPEDQEVTVALFNDPDDDGDPRNAELLATATAVPDELGGSVFTDFAIDPSTVSGGFFVAVYTYTVAGEDRPAAMDGSGTTEHSWLVYNPASKGINLDDLGANAMSLPIDEVPGFFTGAWMVRATGVADTVLGDLTGDGVVNVSDLLQLLAAWGDCAECPADLNGDGTVNVSDLLLLLANWG